MEEREGTSAAARPDDGSWVTLFLGLYLLVLAFFIVLVSISTPEQVKSKAVKDSLSSAFSSLLPPTMRPETFLAKEGDVVAAREFQERITGVFAAAMRVARIEIVQPGRLMRVLVPADVMFEAGGSRIRDTQIALLDRVVASLSARPPGLRYDMEFVVGSADSGGGAMPTGQTLEIARAGAFAREMTGRGAPPDSVAIGVRPGDPGDVAIWFWVRGADETILRLRGPEGSG